MPFAKVDFGLIAYCVGDVLRSQIALHFTEDLRFLYWFYLRQEFSVPIEMSRRLYNKKAHIDVAPVSNADIALTLAHVLHLELPQNGRLVGRIIAEALVEGPDVAAFVSGIKESEATASGIKTRLRYQKVNGTLYFDSAGFEERTVGLASGEK
jgi:hypothetical protein